MEVSGKTIGIALFVVVIIVVLLSTVGYLFVKKDGFSGVRTMLGKSKIDKLIDKINSFLKE